MRLLLENVRPTAAAGRHSGVESSGAGLAEGSIEPLVESERIGAEFGATHASNAIGASAVEGVGDVEILVAVRALFDEGAGNGVAHRGVRGGGFGFAADEDRVARRVAEGAVGRRWPGFSVVGRTHEANGGVVGLISHAAGAMVLGFVDRDEVASGQGGILHDRAGRGVIFVKFGVVDGVAGGEGDGRLEYLCVVPERSREGEVCEVRGLEDDRAATAVIAGHAAGAKDKVGSASGNRGDKRGVLVRKIEEIRRRRGVRPDRFLIGADGERCDLEVIGGLRVDGRSVSDKDDGAASCGAKDRD